MRIERLPYTLLAGALAIGAASADERRLRLSPTVSLQVTEAGAGGEPVVLIPGLFGSAFGFRHVLPRFAAAGYHAIVVEPLGVGRSSRPPDADYSLTAQADRIEQVLEMLRVERAILVGHAEGASIALRLAYRHADRVAAVVSLDGGPVEVAATPGLRRAVRMASILKLFGGVKRIRKSVRKTLETRSADAAWVTEEVVDGYTAAAAHDLDAVLAAYRGMVRSREPQQLRAHLFQIRCPVRLLVGGVPHEGEPSSAEIALLREHLPSFALDRVPRCGHFIAEESPDAVVAAVDHILGAARPSRVLARKQQSAAGAQHAPLRP